MNAEAPGLEILETPEAVARRAASSIAAALGAAIAERGRAALAVSGGTTPTQMLAELAREPLPWQRIDLFQVDERVAPRGDARNATMIGTALASVYEHALERCHWMPVERADLDAAARDYERELAAIAGTPPVLDVVHLGLGADGHTGSLFPASAALAADAEVTVTENHGGWRRMTLTLAALNRARAIIWIVCGRDKREALAALLRGDHEIVASRVRRTAARVLADRAAVDRFA